jgi:hypothetical protein
MIKNYLQHAVAAAFLVASGTAIPAFAAEVEQDSANNSFGSPQRLVVDSTKMVEVRGAVGVIGLTTPVVSDFDYYSFHGRKGDVVTIDIDEGFKGSGSSTRSLDTLIGIWGPGGLFEQMDDPRTVDDGSINRRDARLDQVVLKQDGLHVVGVTSAGVAGGVARKFLPDGSATAFVANSTANGSYLLIISGVSPSLKQISIDIKPGADRYTRINPKAKGTIPVALLSSDDFDATKVDESSLRFGPTGTEASGHCNKHRADLLCHFDLGAAGFDESDEEGIVTGTIDGMQFEGRSQLKVLQIKRKDD